MEKTEPGTRIVVRLGGSYVELDADVLAAKFREIDEMRDRTPASPSMCDELIEDRRKERERELREEGW